MAEPEKYASVDDAHTKGEKLKADGKNLVEITGPGPDDLKVKASTRKELDDLTRAIVEHEDLAKAAVKEEESKLLGPDAAFTARVDKLAATNVELAKLKDVLQKAKPKVKNSAEMLIAPAAGIATATERVLNKQVLPLLKDAGTTLNVYFFKPIGQALKTVSPGLLTWVTKQVEAMGFPDAAKWMRNEAAKKTPEEAAAEKETKQKEANLAKYTKMSGDAKLGKIELQAIDKEPGTADDIAKHLADIELAIQALNAKPLGAFATQMDKVNAKLPMPAEADGTKRNVTLMQMQKATVEALGL